MCRHHQGAHLFAVGNIDLRVISHGDIVVAEDAYELTPELSTGTRDENPHRYPDRCFSGSHHQRLSRYHVTVDAISSLNSRSGVQPSARTLSVAIE